MSVISVKEIASKRTGSVSLEEHTYSRSFRVLTDDKDDAAYAVMAGVGINLRDAYVSWHATETDTRARAKSFNATCDDDGGKTWTVTVEYGKISSQTDEPENEPENPVDRPAQISIDSAKYDRIVDEDINGDAILNSAKDPFDPALVRDDSRTVLTVTKNYASFTNWAYTYRDTLNDAPFMGADTGEVKCDDISWTGPHYENDYEFWTASFQFHHNPDGWTKRVLNQGLRELDDEGERVNIKDSEGNDITAAVPLDGSGHALPADGTPVFLEFEIYESKNFSVFGL